MGTDKLREVAVGESVVGGGVCSPTVSSVGREQVVGGTTNEGRFTLMEPTVERSVAGLEMWSSTMSYTEMEQTIGGAVDEGRGSSSAASSARFPGALRETTAAVEAHVVAVSAISSAVLSAASRASSFNIELFSPVLTSARFPSSSRASRGRLGAATTSCIDGVGGGTYSVMMI